MLILSDAIEIILVLGLAVGAYHDTSRIFFDLAIIAAVICFFSFIQVVICLPGIWTSKDFIKLKKFIKIHCYVSMVVLVCFIWLTLTMENLVRAS